MSWVFSGVFVRERAFEGVCGSSSARALSSASGAAQALADLPTGVFVGSHAAIPSGGWPSWRAHSLAPSGPFFLGPQALRQHAACDRQTHLWARFASTDQSPPRLRTCCVTVVARRLAGICPALGEDRHATALDSWGPALREVHACDAFHVFAPPIERFECRSAAALRRGALSALVPRGARRFHA